MASTVYGNLNHINRFESKTNPKPLTETAVTRGFEAFAFPKLVRELHDDDPRVRSKAVIAARELLVYPQCLVQCLTAGITPALVQLLQDDDAVVRETTAATMQLIAAKGKGCEDMLRHGAVQQLVSLTRDSVLAVQNAAYNCLLEAARQDCIKHALIDQRGTMRQLAAVAAGGQPPHSAMALSLLNSAIQVRHNEAALSQLIENEELVTKLAKLLPLQQPPEIKRLAVQLLTTLTATRFDAKIAAVQGGCVEQLLELIAANDVPLAVASASSLMFITTMKEGKVAVHDANGADKLVALLRSVQEEQLRVNLLNCVANVAELEDCRTQFKILRIAELLERLQSEAASPTVEKAAAHALRQMGFKHWPMKEVPAPIQRKV